ncbi:pyridoxamine 5'-phosphate oxidase family protein [Streptomyces sp. NPDC004539]|uniref:helix-turn-helix domain-containing protein n=1 Tax=Streptomyces sp. NPDC004539 TaxID=3154280 RepID=UPI0033BB529C
MTAPDPPTAAGDLGRRITRRRADLGLSRQDIAARTGMAPSYLRYLEERAGASPGSGVLRRLADALDTTVVALTGGAADRPVGLARARRTRLVELTPNECRVLLATHGVGRLAVPTLEGPLVVPVNYGVVAGAVVYRTAPGTVLARADGCRVALEADRIDEAFSRGWSVLVRGLARRVTDPAEVLRLTETAHSEPWAGGARELWLRIDTLAVTGRRIVG